FLSASYAGRRDLPSFPTRRSSDLPGQQGLRATLGRQLQARRPAHQRLGVERLVGEARSPLAAPLEAQERAGDGLDEPRHAGQLVDRKSTRLNSSHVKISYAVFCLK